MKIAIIYSEYYPEVFKGQKKQILEFVSAHNIEIEWFLIPGSLEAPFMASKIIKNGGFDGLVVLGCVIEGETYHNFIIQETAHSALVNLSVQHLIPIGIGILTVKNYDQALVRSSDKKPYAKHAIQAVFDLLK